MAKPKKLDPYWETRPEWVKKVDRVMKLKEKGLQESQIIALTEIDQFEVKRILEDEKHTLALIDKNNKESLPLLKRIRAMSLEVLSRELQQMLEPEHQRMMITNIRDVVALKVIVNDISMLIRLEEDKSTQNVAVATNNPSISIPLSDPVFSPPKEEDVN